MFVRSRNHISMNHKQPPISLQRVSGYFTFNFIKMDCTVVEIRVHVFERRRRVRQGGTEGGSEQERAE